MSDLIVPPKVELKFPQVNFQKLVYPRIQSKVLEVMHIDLLFSLAHGIYCNRAWLFIQNRADDDLDDAQTQHAEGRTWSRILRTFFALAIQWEQPGAGSRGRCRSCPGIKEDLLTSGTWTSSWQCPSSVDMKQSAPSSSEPLWNLGNREIVLKRKVLLVNKVVGVLDNKLEWMHRRAVPQVHLPFPWQLSTWRQLYRHYTARVVSMFSRQF